MKIDLPGLNSDFKIYSSNNKSITADNYSFTVEPGIYFISSKENISIVDFNKDDISFEQIKKYGEFINDFESTEIKNLTPSSFYENEEKKITVEIYSKAENPKATIYIRKPGWWNPGKYELTKINDFRYEFTLPAEISSNGKLNYFITVEQDGGVLTFPCKIDVTPA